MRIVRGDSTTLDLTVIRQGSAVDLNGAKIWFTAKLDRSVADVDADLALNSVDNPSQVIFLSPPADGRAQIQLSPADTGALTGDAYYYDVQVKEADGTITTVVTDILHVDRDVTKATA